MLFVITPLADIGKHSFRVANHYLGKDKKDNSLISWAWEISDAKMWVDGECIDQSMPKGKLRKIHQSIHRGKVSYVEHRYLNEAGVALLLDVFDKLGVFKFAIHKDDELPSPNLQSLDISDIKSGLLLSCDATLLVSDKDNPKSKTMPSYPLVFW